MSVDHGRWEWVGTGIFGVSADLRRLGSITSFWVGGCRPFARIHVVLIMRAGRIDLRRENVLRICGTGWPDGLGLRIGGMSFRSRAGALACGSRLNFEGVRWFGLSITHCTAAAVAAGLLGEWSGEHVTAT